MSEISKAYEPQQVEAKWYPIWETAGAFKGVLPEGHTVPPHSIVIPPPNVTGVLHMGHILNNTMQDILTRRARQEGKAAVWVPGTDHAGIATQTRVEKELRKEGKTKWDLGREAFLEKACQWRDEHGGIILQQLRKLGASCDWDRTVHTLDEGYSRAVLTAFVELFQKGRIYRGKRMVNWCPKSLTALSDEEVIMKPQKGVLFKMKYEIAEHPGQFVEISTTRPETLMGDTAVAIHPKDERYRHLHGCHVYRPFPKAKIPFVLDEHVDMEFGTGVLKVTPAHDRADFDIGQRHSLEVIDVLTPDGKINCPDCPELHGKDRFEARKLAGNMLEAMGLLVEREKYENNVGFSERADVPIEPRLSDQWWLKYPKVDEAREAVASGRIKFYPERWTKTYAHWLENIQDWCISRQLWWGHRIPVWYRKGIDRENLTVEDLQNPEKVHVSVEGPADPNNWEQEDDVLDTWASSWLWPFGVHDWPAGTGLQKKELEYWYPTEVLATGPDIIFFWVARMIMAGLEFMGDVPFRHVVFNGIIRDAQGRKMSKSLGNSPDPLDLIEQFGADGLRLGMLMMAPKGSDILFSEDRVQLGRNFCNKLWNACRFRQLAGQGPAPADASHRSGADAPRPLMAATAKGEVVKDATASWVKGLSLVDADDHAIIAKLIATLEATESAYQSFEFNKLTDALYKFFWTDYCDWYVEVSKAKLQSEDQRGGCIAILDLCLRSVIQMLHPIAPFITEELWQRMDYGGRLPSADQRPASGLSGSHDTTFTFIQDASLLTAEKLKEHLVTVGISLEASALLQVEALQDFVVKARALKAQYSLANKNDVNFFLVGDEANRAKVDSHLEKLRKLIGFGSLRHSEDIKNMPSEITPLGTLYLDLAGSVDVEAEKKKLQKQIDQLNKAITGSEKALSNEKFINSAPADVIAARRETLEANKAKRAELESLIAGLKH